MTRRARINAAALFALAFAGAVATAAEWRIQARLFPWIIGFPALALCAIQLVLDLRRAVRPAGAEDGTGIADVPVDSTVPLGLVLRGAGITFGWVFGLFVAIWVFGFILSTALFVALYLRVMARETWWKALAYTGLVVAFQIGVFHHILRLPWPPGLIPGPERFVLAWLG
jgi:hypothetical protein